MNTHASAIAQAPSAATVDLPTPHQLAGLGTVLCLYRQQAGGELAGWSQAVRAEVGVEIDSDGMRESLLFHDRAGRCCWRLYLLPDSDFLAWERLSDTLPLHAEPQATAGIGERLLRRLAGGSGGRWAGSILRLHALGGPGLAPAAVLAASLARASRLGTAEAIRIVCSQGADGSALVDGCCCERAARSARAADGANAARAAGQRAPDRRSRVRALLSEENVQLPVAGLSLGLSSRPKGEICHSSPSDAD